MLGDVSCRASVLYVYLFCHCICRFSFVLVGLSIRLFLPLLFSSALPSSTSCQVHHTLAKFTAHTPTPHHPTAICVPSPISCQLCQLDNPYHEERRKEEEKKERIAKQNSEENKYGWAGLPAVGESSNSKPSNQTNDDSFSIFLTFSGYPLLILSFNTVNGPLDHSGSTSCIARLQDMVSSSGQKRLGSQVIHWNEQKQYQTSSSSYMDLSQISDIASSGIPYVATLTVPSYLICHFISLLDRYWTFHSPNIWRELVLEETSFVRTSSIIIRSDSGFGNCIKKTVKTGPHKVNNAQ